MAGCAGCAAAAESLSPGAESLPSEHRLSLGRGSCASLIFLPLSLSQSTTSPIQSTTNTRLAIFRPSLRANIETILNVEFISAIGIHSMRTQYRQYIADSSILPGFPWRRERETLGNWQLPAESINHPQNNRKGRLLRTPFSF
jgi:hypothetical protein